MVAVALYHRPQVFLIARVDESRVVVWILLSAPAVECLSDDKHAERVAGIEEGTCGGIVRRADKAEACLLHLSHLTYLRIVECHCPEDTVVVMHAGTIDKHRAAIEHKAVLSIEGECADAIAYGLLV